MAAYVEQRGGENLARVLQGLSRIAGPTGGRGQPSTREAAALANRVAFHVQSEMVPAIQQQIPVRTGRLRNGISAGTDGNAVAIGSDVFYANLARFSGGRTTRSIANEVAGQQLARIVRKAYRQTIGGR